MQDHQDGLLDFDAKPPIQKYSRLAFLCFIPCLILYITSFTIMFNGMDEGVDTIGPIMGLLHIISFPVNLTGVAFSISAIKEHRTPIKFIALIGNGIVFAFNALVIFFGFFA